MTPTASSSLSGTGPSADSVTRRGPWKDFGKVLDQVVDLLGGRQEDGEGARGMTSRRVPDVERGPGPR